MRRAIVTSVILAAVAVGAPRQARADFGIGLFLGEPTGLDMKIDIQRRSALDLVLGFSTFRDGRADYGHLTYLVTPFVGRGRSVSVPLRLGIGVAIFDAGGFGNNVDVGVRAPLEVGLMF